MMPVAGRPTTARLPVASASSDMRSVTIDPSTGEVVIRCPVEEAMAIEAAMVSFTGDAEVNQHISPVWDLLDNLRVKLMATNPSCIPEWLQRFRVAIKRRR